MINLTGNDRSIFLAKKLIEATDKNTIQLIKALIENIELPIPDSIQSDLLESN